MADSRIESHCYGNQYPFTYIIYMENSDILFSFSFHD